MRRSVIGDANKNVPIAVTSLGYEAGLVGAASLVWSRLQSNQNYE
ncbi:hypothetical protein [Gordoniibacillus kamchatkensis]|nr:hypothetical protein [Paenibacillus sp. VKM B-2647]